MVLSKQILVACSLMYLTMYAMENKEELWSFPLSIESIEDESLRLGVLFPVKWQLANSQVLTAIEQCTFNSKNDSHNNNNNDLNDPVITFWSVSNTELKFAHVDTKNNKPTKLDHEYFVKHFMQQIMEKEGKKENGGKMIFGYQGGYWEVRLSQGVLTPAAELFLHFITYFKGKTHTSGINFQFAAVPSQSTDIASQNILSEAHAHAYKVVEKFRNENVFCYTKKQLELARNKEN